MPGADVSSITIRDKVAFLREPASWPQHPARVEVIETHMSWIFLIDNDVYKLKKPVRYSFLDFSNLVARQRFCEEEVRLNRRLARPVYLGTVPLTWCEDSLHIGGDGECVDCLVHMQRLDSAHMLDQQLKNRTVDAKDLRPLARLLAEFHADAVQRPMVAGAYVKRFRNSVIENQRELSRPEFGLNTEEIDHTLQPQHAFLQQHEKLLAARADCLVDAHGDLRPEHVYLGSPPMVIDCLEFNPDLRTMDPLDELAFLSMDCARLGGNFVAAELLAAHEDVFRERPSAELWAFYWRYRAALRAKLAIWHLEDNDVRDPDKWHKRAHSYLTLANNMAAATMP